MVGQLRSDLMREGESPGIMPGPLGGDGGQEGSSIRPRNQSGAVEAHETLELILGDRAPYGLLDLLAG
ncbi:MAG: hypothetical protein ABWY45_08640 [Mycobacterium sp.]